MLRLIIGGDTTLTDWVSVVGDLRGLAWFSTRETCLIFTVFSTPVVFCTFGLVWFSLQLVCLSLAGVVVGGAEAAARALVNEIMSLLDAGLSCRALPATEIGMTLEGLLDPEGGKGDLLRFEAGGVYLTSICCLVVKVEALGE